MPHQRHQPPATRSWPKRSWYEFSRLWVRLGLTVLYHARYSGMRTVPPTGGLLVVSNHQSYLDPPVIGAGFPRMMSYLARESLFRFAPFAWLIQSYDAIPLDLEGSSFGGMKETLRRLKRGDVVLVFPEGSRTADGEIAPFLPGFAALALRSGAGIVPTAIEGAFEAWPQHARLPKAGNLHVHYGVPMTPEEVSKYGQAELVAEVERRVRYYHAQLRRHPVFAGRRKDA